MSRRYGYRSSRYESFYPPYVSVGEKRARNQAAARELRDKHGDLQPVTISGRTIATSWWGKSWNQNLERYADYSNRIGRGRSYVCHGAVLDLRIVPGKVLALVQGSRPSPYQVTVTIAKLGEAAWQHLRDEAVKSLNSLPELLAGRFPQALKDVFFAQGSGLFPSPKEIQLECSCPDWANMCKHVAAVLYGIGNRLDRSPELLFTLRQVTVEDLISQSVAATSKTLLERAGQAAGADVLGDENLGEVFGIDLGGDAAATPAAKPTAKVAVRVPHAAPAPDPAPVPVARAGRPKTRKLARVVPPTPGPEPTAKVKRGRPAKVARSAAPTRRQASAPAPVPRRGNMVADFVTALPVGKPMDIHAIEAILPGWTKLQVANTLQRAIVQGLMERVRHGSYRRRLA